MDRQIAVRMPAQLAMRLDRVARRTGRTRSDVTREALERFLAGPDLTTRPIDRVRDLIGAIESGLPDVGQRHRDYLLRQVRRVR
jgi:predicted transcriptional regulator